MKSSNWRIYIKDQKDPLHRRIEWFVIIVNLDQKYRWSRSLATISKRKEAHGTFEGRKTGIEIFTNYLPIKGWVVRYLWVFRCYGRVRMICLLLKTYFNMAFFNQMYHVCVSSLRKHSMSFLLKKTSYRRVLHILFHVFANSWREYQCWIRDAIVLQSLTNYREFLSPHVKNIFHSNYPE